MKHVFQENPKFGDEQDVTQQIIAIDEAIEKQHAEIKRFEVKQRFSFSLLILCPCLQSYISEVDTDMPIRSRNIYDSDQLNEFHRLPSIDTTHPDSNNSFEDEDTNDFDQIDSQYSKASALYDFNGKKETHEIFFSFKYFSNFSSV